MIEDNKGASADADRATAAEPVVSALRDGIPSAADVEVTYEVWEDDMLVASSTSLEDAKHYLRVYSQDAAVHLKTAFTYRFHGIRGLFYPRELFAAQAMETRKGGNAKTGSVRQHDSAVRQDAPEATQALPTNNPSGEG